MRRHNTQKTMELENEPKGTSACADDFPPDVLEAAMNCANELTRVYETSTDEIDREMARSMHKRARYIKTHTVPYFPVFRSVLENTLKKRIHIEPVIDDRDQRLKDFIAYTHDFFEIDIITEKDMQKRLETSKEPFQQDEDNPREPQGPSQRNLRKKAGYRAA